MRSQWIRVGPNSNEFPYRRQKRTPGDTEKPCEDGGRVRGLCLQASGHQDSEQPPEPGREAWDRFSLSLQKKSTLPTP